MRALLPQRCPLAFVYLSWAVYVTGLVYFAARAEYAWAGLWLVALPVAWWVYVRTFPRWSHLWGYGRVDDVPAADVRRSSVVVTMYGALGCPFCRIVEERLRGLRDRMGFDLVYVDVTLRPDVLRSRGIRSVPVVEVGERRWVGHATTEQLAQLIGGEPDRGDRAGSVQGEE
jgi:glutaredoxin